MTPLVSVVIAVFNGERFIREAIRSVLDQGHEALELIVVDDGSTDATAEALAEFSAIRAVHQDNGGQASALNHGLRLAKGDLFAFNDADDVWTPGRLAIQLEALASDPGLEAVYGHVEQFLEDDAPAAVRAGLTPERRVMPSRLHSAMLVRREAFERLGPFRTEIGIGSVVEWAARAKDALSDRVLDEIVLRRRLHGANIGVTRKAAATEDYLAIVRAAIAKRRESGN
ncbi:glycosyltransferase [Gaopeijia maritima]|uniref:Glycosyltransferase n=1 Tax=Gaopeijia maritima TaxID=3119007 RepID=A0ABU9E6G1_9BACT